MQKTILSALPQKPIDGKKLNLIEFTKTKVSLSLFIFLFYNFVFYFATYWGLKQLSHFTNKRKAGK